MKGISQHVKGVVVGGLIAGAIIVGSAVLMVPVVGDMMNRALADRNVPPMGPVAMAFVGFASIALGIVLVWLNSALRRSSGDAVRCSVKASFVVWFLCYFFGNASNAAMGLLPIGLCAVGTAWGLVELVVAGLAGSAAYNRVVRSRPRQI